jgi:hypothetical protein
MLVCVRACMCACVMEKMIESGKERAGERVRGTERERGEGGGGGEKFLCVREFRAWVCERGPARVHATMFRIHRYP